MKTENWNNHQIRFVGVKGEWWAVLSDVAEALSLRTDKLNARLEDDNLLKVPVKDSLGRIQETSIVSEFGIYEAVFSSRKPEAKDFKRWVFSVIKELREQTGLEGFQVFRMLDKERQKSTMTTLKQSLKAAKKVDYIKANTISNKAVSTKYGYPKMVKKDDMTPAMLAERQAILDETVELMAVKEKFGLDISVSEKIYNRSSESQIA